MVKMYSTHRPADRTCVAQRGTLMLMGLVLMVLFSMRRFSKASLKDLEGSYNSNVIIKSNTGVVSASDSDRSSSSDNIDESSTTGVESSSILSKFPSFEQGGVVVFYHASRTGGLTIRQNFINRHEDGIKYVKLGHSTQALVITDKIVRHILERSSSTRTTTTTTSNTINQDANEDADADAANNNADADAPDGGGAVVVEAAPARPRPESFVLEIPGELTTLMQLSQLLEQWRILAIGHGTSFFAFTLIRDPVPFHVSFFNTYSVPFFEPTVQNLLESMPRNEQCRRIVQNNNNNNIVVVEEGEEGQESLTQCQEAYNWMRTSLDWIGTTENLNQDTLPILSHLLLQDASIGQSMPRFVAQTDATSDNKLHMEYLSEDDAARIREMSDMDQKLYEDVLQDFSFAMKSNNNQEQNYNDVDESY